MKSAKSAGGAAQDDPKFAVPEIWFAAFAGAATRLSAMSKPAKSRARIRMADLQSEWSSPSRRGSGQQIVAVHYQRT